MPRRRPDESCRRGDSPTRAESPRSSERWRRSRGERRRRRGTGRRPARGSRAEGGPGFGGEVPEGGGEAGVDPLMRGRVLEEPVEARERAYGPPCRSQLAGVLASRTADQGGHVAKLAGELSSHGPAFERVPRRAVNQALHVADRDRGAREARHRSVLTGPIVR